jgi:hypothetical protein
MKYDRINAKLLINGLSDHNARIISLGNINVALQKNNSKGKYV